MSRDEELLAMALETFIANVRAARLVLDRLNDAQRAELELALTPLVDELGHVQAQRRAH